MANHFRESFRGFILRENSTSAQELEPQFPRLIQRDLPFDQSKNKVHINHGNSRRDLYALLRYNWFHVFLRLPTWKSLLLLLVCWTVLLLIFAGLYCWADRGSPQIDCGLGNAPGEVISYSAAFSFSLETCTTVGYGLPGGTNAFFEDCPGIQTTIYFQMVISMMCNAFLFAFFFARLAKSESRAIQVVFSDKCVVRHTSTQKLVLQFRVYDVDANHAIVEAHVRMYALLKHKDADGHPQLVHLRVSSPNDELGGVMFLSIPSVVTHEIDSYSSLQQHRRPSDYQVPSSQLLSLRQVDAITGNRDDVVCSVCGESYGTLERLAKHVAYQKMVEKKDDYPLQGSHREMPNVVPQKPMSLGELRDFTQLQELICVVEGIDPLTSGTFQALHSYTPDEIVWGGRFVPCLTSTVELSTTFVDLQLFHQVEMVESGIAEEDEEESSSEEEKTEDGLHDIVPNNASNKV